jgi:hypothetical protein
MLFLMPSAKQERDPVTVFVSYSQSETDRPLRAELIKHLVLMRDERLVEVWDDQQIIGAANWEAELKERLKSADLILALVSIDFLSSEYIRTVELKVALDRHRRGEAKLLPIILSPCEWQRSPLAEIQVLPHRAKPVSSWADKAEAFLNIAEVFALRPAKFEKWGCLVGAMVRASLTVRR